MASFQYQLMPNCQLDLLEVTTDPEGIFRADCCCVIGPSEFFVTLPVNDDRKEHLCQQMQNFYEQQQLPLEQVEVGVLCAAWGKAEGEAQERWHRAVVVEEITNDLCSVFYVDNGFIDDVETDRLMQLESIFAKRSPFAIRCSYVWQKDELVDYNLPNGAVFTPKTFKEKILGAQLQLKIGTLERDRLSVDVAVDIDGMPRSLKDILIGGPPTPLPRRSVPGRVALANSLPPQLTSLPTRPSRLVAINSHISTAAAQNEPEAPLPPAVSVENQNPTASVSLVQPQRQESELYGIAIVDSSSTQAGCQAAAAAVLPGATATASGGFGLIRSRFNFDTAIPREENGRDPLGFRVAGDDDTYLAQRDCPPNPEVNTLLQVLGLQSEEDGAVRVLERYGVSKGEAVDISLINSYGPPGNIIYVYRAKLGDHLFTEAMANKKATAKNKAALEALSELMTFGELHTTSFHPSQFPHIRKTNARYYR